MDAHELPVRPAPGVRRLEHIAIIVLAVLCALGLWQGYGAWLFGGHVC
jgi:hypothetical protein